MATNQIDTQIYTYDSSVEIPEQGYRIFGPKTKYPEKVEDWLYQNGLNSNAIYARTGFRPLDVMNQLSYGGNNFVGGFIGKDKFLEILFSDDKNNFREGFTILAEIPDTEVTFELAMKKEEAVELGIPFTSDGKEDQYAMYSIDEIDSTANIESINLLDRKIFTSYPGLLKALLRDKIDLRMIWECDGAVEDQANFEDEYIMERRISTGNPTFGERPLVGDIVESGGTLRSLNFGRIAIFQEKLPILYIAKRGDEAKALSALTDIDEGWIADLLEGLQSSIDYQATLIDLQYDNQNIPNIIWEAIPKILEAMKD